MRFSVCQKGIPRLPRHGGVARDDNGEKWLKYNGREEKSQQKTAHIFYKRFYYFFNKSIPLKWQIIFLYHLGGLDGLAMSHPTNVEGCEQ
mgnify:CR=1 FL=1